MARVIAITNQKGGVGKTTTSINLAAALALRNRKVLLIDIDPQGNATSGLGINKADLNSTIYDVFANGAELASIIVPTNHASLLLAPSSSNLVGVELEVSQKQGREAILKTEISKVSSQFDYILIDCPPSLGIMTVNAIVASNSLLIPLQTEYYALEGVSALMETVKLAREQLNPALELEGVILTMYDGRTNLARQVEQEAENFFGDFVFNTPIPRNVRLSECPSFGQSIFEYDANSAGALSYKLVAEELEKRRSKADKEEAKKAKKAGNM
jgi:chromosome partitioning protein